jgi:U6 snRNA-associated Sm-like protein LSm7
MLNLSCDLTCFSVDPEDSERITDNTRRLGLVVIRGTQVSLVSPVNGVEEIANPFLVADD